MKMPGKLTFDIVEDSPEKFLSNSGVMGWIAWAIRGANAALSTNGPAWVTLTREEKWRYTKTIGKPLSEAHLSALNVSMASALDEARSEARAEALERTLEGKVEALAKRVEELASAFERLGVYR